VLAAEITNSTVDWSQLDPMVSATIAELERAGVNGRPETALADTQYWNEEHIDEVIANKHIQVLIPPDSGTREKPRPGWTGGRDTWMRHVLAAEPGEQLYRKRKQMIEPVFGHTKHNRGVTRFHRRGRPAVRTGPYPGLGCRLAWAAPACSTKRREREKCIEMCTGCVVASRSVGRDGCACAAGYEYRSASGSPGANGGAFVPTAMQNFGDGHDTALNVGPVGTSVRPGLAGFGVVWIDHPRPFQCSASVVCTKTPTDEPTAVQL